MRAMKGLAAGVLTALLAGTGCCKLCDWCHGGSEKQSRSLTADGLPAANVTSGTPPTATPAANRLPTGTPGTQQPATPTNSVQVGAYGGSGY